MRRKTVTAVVLGLTLGSAAAWTLGQRRTTEQVPYSVVDRVAGVELRQYPPAVAVETTASSERVAFGRLFRYLSGSNRARADVSMTAPVETVARTRSSGREVAMTAPVGTRGANDGDGVRMSFYLPTDYDHETAPEPTEDRVHLVAIPERVAAVRRFSWWSTAGRVAAQTHRLERGLRCAGYRADGEPTLLRYDPPWALPLLRRNEVAVTVRPADD